MLDSLDRVVTRLGLKISARKTKVLGIVGDAPGGIQLGGDSIEAVDSFVYLGSRITSSTTPTDEVRVRIGKATAAFYAFDKLLWSRTEVTINTKMRIYNAAVLPVLLYGAESWCTKEADIRMLEVFQARCLRRILQISLLDRVTNIRARELCNNQPSITSRVTDMRLRWFGHVVRMPEGRLTRTALLSTAPESWRKPRGGQPKCWKHNVSKDIACLHLTFEEAVHIASTNRKQWKAVIRDISCAPRAKVGQSLPYQR